MYAEAFRSSMAQNNRTTDRHIDLQTKSVTDSVKILTGKNHGLAKQLP